MRRLPGRGRKGVAGRADCRPSGSASPVSSSVAGAGRWIQRGQSPAAPTTPRLALRAGSGPADDHARPRSDSTAELGAALRGEGNLLPMPLSARDRHTIAHRLHRFHVDAWWPQILAFLDMGITNAGTEGTPDGQSRRRIAFGFATWTTNAAGRFHTAPGNHAGRSAQRGRFLFKSEESLSHRSSSLFAPFGEASLVPAGGLVPVFGVG